MDRISYLLYEATSRGLARKRRGKVKGQSERYRCNEDKNSGIEREKKQRRERERDKERERGDMVMVNVVSVMVVGRRVETESIQISFFNSFTSQARTLV